MTTYYEILKLQPAATATEIEATIEEQYNQWRRLVTHHDPNVADEANRALRTLEQVRATLTDPDKRAAYDAGIGVGEQVGGLADPAALLQAAVPSPPQPSASQQISPAPASQRVDAWVCPQCQTPNMVGVKHCPKCGHQIGRDCPKCKKAVAIADPFCLHCGVELATFVRQQEQERLQKLQAQIKEEYAAIQELEHTSRQYFVLPWAKNFSLYKSLNQSSTGCVYQLVAYPVFTIVWILILLHLVTGGRCETALFAFLGATILVGWLNNRVVVRPEAGKRIQEHRDQIANLEQKIRQVQAGERALQAKVENTPANSP